MVSYHCPREEVVCTQPVAPETTFATFLLTPRYAYGGTPPNRPDAAIHHPAGLTPTLLVISRRPTAEWIMQVYFDPLFQDCQSIGNDLGLPVFHEEIGFVRLNRTCGRSKSARCQLGRERWKRTVDTATLQDGVCS